MHGIDTKSLVKGYCATQVSHKHCGICKSLGIDAIFNMEWVSRHEVICQSFLNHCGWSTAYSTQLLVIKLWAQLTKLFVSVLSLPTETWSFYLLLQAQCLEKGLAHSGCSVLVNECMNEYLDSVLATGAVSLLSQLPLFLPSLPRVSGQWKNDISMWRLWAALGYSRSVRGCGFWCRLGGPWLSRKVPKSLRDLHEECCEVHL